MTIGRETINKTASSGATLRAALLLTPCVLALCVWGYNSIEPRLFGFPFFYWAQIALIPISVLFILAVYLLERR